MLSSSYLQVRNGYYHFRLRTPKDLLGIIHHRELTKSLKTTDLKTARVSAIPFLQGVRQTVSFLRSRIITPEQAHNSLVSLFNYKPKAVFSIPEKTLQKANMESVSLSGVVKSFVSDREKGWTPKTKMETLGVFRIITDLLGEKTPVTSIDRPLVRDFREMLLKLPPNVYKVYPKLTPLEVIKQVEEGKLQAVPMSITSVNKHISRLSTLMQFSIKDGHRLDNPASDMNLKEKRRQDEERKAYDREDLQRIIKKLPQDIKTPERYWVPLVCMFSGMRLDEACQLYREDIKRVDDIWCLDINDSKDKKLKNTSSRRVIPVHPKLIDLGFVDYVESCTPSTLTDTMCLFLLLIEINKAYLRGNIQEALRVCQGQLHSNYK